MFSRDLNEDEYADFYRHYILKCPEAIALIQLLEENKRLFLAFLSKIPEVKWGYRYLPGKWTIKEMLLHIIDTERIMAYRALRIARRDNTPLPGFNQDLYAANSFAENRSAQNLLDEYKAVRDATLFLFKSLSEEDFIQKTIASENTVSVRALGFIICGHELHHIDIIKQKYLG